MELRPEILNRLKITKEEVLFSLNNQTNQTNWGKKTKHYAVNYINELSRKYGEQWYKGNLPLKYFFDIMLQKHSHLEEGKAGPFLLVDDTSIRRSLNLYRKHDPLYNKDCLELILYLKEEIRNKGFTTEVYLTVDNHIIKHIDGLHRLIALGLLIEEGHKYNPIPINIFIPNNYKD